MVTSLFRYERITTTKAKALEVRKSAEKLITRSKVDTVHNRRQVARFIADPVILAKLFVNIGPRMKERPGGYTRILKTGFRQGDAADTAILELVDYKLEDKSDKSKGKTKDKQDKSKDDKGKKPVEKQSVEKKASSRKTAGAGRAKSKEKAVKPVKEETPISEEKNV
jgi:large subunit ribosomal protein L17